VAPIGCALPRLAASDKHDDTMMLPFHLKSPRSQHSLVAVFVALTLGLGGCAAWQASPDGAALGDQAPINLRSLELAAAQGRQAVLLRMSRLPTMVRHSSSSNPGRITIQAWGPQTGGDLPERALPQQEDPLVEQVRVSRKGGALTVILDLRSDVAPPYAVHEMADWIMVRLGEPQA